MKNILYKRWLILIALITVFSIGTMQAQTAKIATATLTGQVVDENGQPVPGIMVKSWVIQGKAITDAQGKFALDVARDLSDKVTIAADNYTTNVVSVSAGTLTLAPVVLEKIQLFDGKNSVELPYGTYRSDQITSAVYTVTGEELVSFPSSLVLEALAGRIPGLVINQGSNTPGQETATAYLRGSAASIYIDGVMRDITGLSTAEVEKVQVFKDYSGRAALGLSGAGPVIWIITKKGTRFDKQVFVSTEIGMRSPTSLPKYVNSFNYATLLNEALDNDGLDKRYSAADLAAYENHTDPIRYPDVNYYSNYVGKSSPFRKANLNFSGGDDRVSYFSMFDYVGNQGLETVGDPIKNNQYKLRGNVDIRLNDYMNLSVNIAGSYQKQRFPNAGSGAVIYNMFDLLSSYPSNAHPTSFQGLLIRSDDYPLNLDNELLYSGFGEGTVINAQNNAKLLIDLNSIVKGLTLTANASFDVSNNIIASKGGTAALYRLQRTALDADTAVRVVEALNVAAMSTGNYFVMRRTASFIAANFDRQFGKHQFVANAAYYMAIEEVKVATAGYQPAKMQDISLRGHYSFDNRYVAQLDLSYTGSGRMPRGERFSLYPTLGSAWIASNESFLKGSAAVNYLKVYTSYGIMGVNDYGLAGYNPFYLTETLWRLNGTWRPGISGNTGSTVNNYNIVQAGTTGFVLPKKRVFNIGVQSELFGRAVSVEIDYFNEKNYDKISNMAASTPTLIGSTQFLPAINYGEDMRWGIDGMVQYRKSVGDFSYSIGANAIYQRDKYLVVDEPATLESYKKLAGKDMDLFWSYQSEGLFHAPGEITSNPVTQSWGAVQPGDIRYFDYNDDKVIDENDIYATGAHSPRFFYGVNLSAGYKGFNLYVLGQGVADGDVRLNSNRYFWINGTKQNYSQLMLDRWPVTDNFPRLTTVSLNNYQSSTFWLSNAAYFRLKNVELSYTLPIAVSKKMAMSNFRVYVRGTNLMVLSGLKKYNVDPENLVAGITGYPVFQTVTLGLSCKF